MNYASSNVVSKNLKDKVVKMGIKLTTLKDQIHILLTYIASRPDVPAYFIAMTPGLAHASNNNV